MGYRLPLSHSSVEDFDDVECDAAFTHNDMMFLQNGSVDCGLSERAWMTEMQKDEGEDVWCVDRMWNGMDIRSTTQDARGRWAVVEEWSRSDIAPVMLPA
ncbi:hypothetical protein NDU88_002184 [Pleurodeles waltl]|uniref:Uncharacterized protein n=1 Tax=Pleurodeles waltl TaxID=8319 RepID=A0AAV7T2J7_PLEWA|nr:hypothetical protein NDU88_002184 [Pleurodeles waltl]